MEYVIKPEWEEIWSEFPFEGFPAKYFEQNKLSEHIREASIILHLLDSGNVGLIADTATGKTIMSLLAVIAARYRTLFLTSRIDLTTQHQEMLNKITRKNEKSRAISGLVPINKREWNDKTDLVIFATPHVVIREFAKKKINLELYDLIVFDEMQHVTGFYPYVPIAAIARDLKKVPKFLALSATPGETRAEMDIIEKILNIKHWHVAEIETPKSPEDIVLADPDETLGKIEKIFLKLLSETAEKIMHCGHKVDPQKIIGWSALRWIARENSMLYGSSDYFKTLLNLAKYNKLYHAYVTVMTESYSTFLGYCFEKLELDRSNSGMEIYEDRRFKKIIELAIQNINRHPKIEKLLLIAESIMAQKKNAIIFISEKRTGNYIKDIFEKRHFPCDTIYGGIGKSRKKQRKTLENLQLGKINFLISTSVIEEGLNVSEVKKVIQYSMPRTGKSRKQRSGRTGRLEPGHNVFIALNHPHDRIFFWITSRKIKEMKMAIAEKAGKKIETNAKIYQRNRGRKRDELTLPLF